MDRTTVQRRRGLKSAGPEKQSDGSAGSKKIQKQRTSILCKLVLIAAILPFVVIGSLVGFRKSLINSVSYELPEAPEFIGPLAPNNILSSAERLLAGQLIGPESIAIHKGFIFTGTHDGKILQLKGDKIIRTLKTSRLPCGEYDKEPICGRPLGIRVLDEKTLIYADAYLGLFKMEITSGKSELLVKGGEMVQGRPLSFLDDVAILKNGTILFTDASSQFPRRDYMLSILEHSSDGRLLSYDLETKKLRVLLDNMYFPNGVEISENEDYALVTETSKARIIKYHLKGPKQGKVSVFAENLPGYPDNVRASKNGSFWVALASIRRRGQLSLDNLGALPALRDSVTKVIPVAYISSAFHFITSKYGLAILIGQDGKIVSSLHDPTGQAVQGISEIADDGQFLYFGSFNAPYLSRLKYN